MTDDRRQHLNPAGAAAIPPWTSASPPSPPPPSSGVPRAFDATLTRLTQERDTALDRLRQMAQLRTEAIHAVTAMREQRDLALTDLAALRQRITDLHAAANASREEHTPGHHQQGQP